jgi:hypothetical protein
MDDPFIMDCKEKEEDSKNDKKKEIYDKDVLFEKIINNSYLSIYTIRKSIKNIGLNKFIDTKQSKTDLIQSLKIYIFKERFYQTNIQKIIKIQSFFRKWLVHRRKLCYNETDILSFTSKYEIPNQYLFIFNDTQTNKKFAYDIRTLIQIINSDYPSCPYTFRNFTENEKNNIKNHVNKLLLYNIDISIEKEPLTPEEEVDMKIKEVFYQINMLDNYTNHMWFKNLTLYQLTELYLKMEDIWNYRSSMTIETKKNIVKNGVAFNIPIHIIKNQKCILKIRHILLDEFLRMINEGKDREEKKLGAMLILTGLCEVSLEASYALPHLIQD